MEFRQEKGMRCSHWCYRAEGLCSRSILEKVFEQVLDRMQIVWQQAVYENCPLV